MLNKLRNLVFHNFYSVFEYVFIAFGHKLTWTYRNIEKEFKMSDLKKEIRIEPLVIIEIGANDGSTTEEFFLIAKFTPLNQINEQYKYSKNGLWEMGV